MCVSPISLTRDILGRKTKVHVPCGVCPECVKDNQNSYVIRAIEEQAKRGSLWFATLTYSNDNVPVAFDADGEIVEFGLVPILSNPSKYRPRSFAPHIPLDENESFSIERDSDYEVDDDSDMPLDAFYGCPGLKSFPWRGVEYAQLDIEADNVVKSDEVCDIATGERPRNVYTLNNKDITNWKKRCRRKIEYRTGANLDFGYLICGEYGPRTHRPHYHALLVGLSDADVLVFRRDWQDHHGFTCFKKIAAKDVERTARYVSKYITKQKCLEEPNVAKGFVAKPRKITSVHFGVPTKKREDMMRKDILGELADLPSFDNFDGVNPIWLDKQIDKLTTSLKYKIDGKHYKLPRYYRQRLLYVKDALTGRYRQTALYVLVSKALQRRVQEDFVEKCRELAALQPFPESYETYSYVSKIVCDSLAAKRQERAQTIIDTNIAAFRKSRF